MAKIARNTDAVSGTCLSHGSPRLWTGVIDNASTGFTVEGLVAAAKGDGGLATCGHRFVITTASTVLKGLAGKEVARQGDSVIMVTPGTGGGTITGGATGTDTV